MADNTLVQKLEKASLDTKLRLLDLCHQTVIHIGGDLSACDMMTAIWQYAMRYDVKNPHWENRDRFILSKGHAAAVTSFSQAAIGCYEFEDIYREYATDFGRFGMHSCNLANPYVDVSTGSLGHGLPVAGGVAAALKRKNSGSRVYCVVGDGECGEGSIWEAALFAHHYSNGISGCTHCGLEDSALMVACNNMTVIEPGDPFQMVKILEAAMELNRPVYIRMGREATTSLYSDDVQYEIGKALIPRDGSDGAFICTGIMVHFAMEAAERIAQETGKQIRVVDMHTIKPLDKDAVIDAAKTGRVVAAQDHNLYGGLGQLVGSAIAEAGISCKLVCRGCPDEFVPIATPEFLYARNGMDSNDLYQAMLSLL